MAIGGIGPSNLAQLKGSGAAGIAVVSSLFGAEDIQAAAQALARQARASFVPPSHSLVPPSQPAASVPPGFDLCTNAAKETPP